MAADSMTRLDSGEYQLLWGGVDYRVRKEQTRIETGRTRGGRTETTWKAWREDQFLGEAPRYVEAKRFVIDDIQSPRGATVSSSSRFSAEQPPLEYDDGEAETDIGPPTLMERRTS